MQGVLTTCAHHSCLFERWACNIWAFLRAVGETTLASCTLHIRKVHMHVIVNTRVFPSDCGSNCTREAHLSASHIGVFYGPSLRTDSSPSSVVKHFELSLSVVTDVNIVWEVSNGLWGKAWNERWREKHKREHLNQPTDRDIHIDTELRENGNKK